MKRFRFNLVPFALQQSLKLATSTGSFSYFLLETGQDCRQPSSVPSSLLIRTGVSGKPLLKVHIVLSFQHWWFHHRRSYFPLPKAQTQPRTTTDSGFLDLLLVTIWIILFFFGLDQTQHPFLQKIPEILIYMITVHVFTLWWSNPRCLRDQRRRRCIWTLLA